MEPKIRNHGQVEAFILSHSNQEVDVFTHTWHRFLKKFSATHKQESEHVRKFTTYEQWHEFVASHPDLRVNDSLWRYKEISEVQQQLEVDQKPPAPESDSLPEKKVEEKPKHDEHKPLGFDLNGIFVLFKRPRILEEDDDYKKIRERKVQGWLTADPTRTLESEAGIDFLHGPDADAAAEAEFRANPKNQKKLAKYDKNRKEIKSYVPSDPQIQLLQDKIAEESMQRFELAQKTDPESTLTAAYDTVAVKRWDGFLEANPEKANAYAKDQYFLKDTPSFAKAVTAREERVAQASITPVATPLVIAAPPPTPQPITPSRPTAPTPTTRKTPLLNIAVLMQRFQAMIARDTVMQREEENREEDEENQSSQSFDQPDDWYDEPQQAEPQSEPQQYQQPQPQQSQPEPQGPSTPNRGLPGRGIMDKANNAVKGAQKAAAGAKELAKLGAQWAARAGAAAAGAAAGALGISVGWFVIIVIIVLVIIVLAVAIACCMGFGPIQLDCGFGIPEEEKVEKSTTNDIVGLALTKSGPLSVENGQPISYSITVSYSGKEDVVVVDPIPDNTTFAEAQGVRTTDLEGEKVKAVRWSLKDNIPVTNNENKKVYKFTIAILPTQSDILIENTAYAEISGYSSSSTTLLPSPLPPETIEGAVVKAQIKANLARYPQSLVSYQRAQEATGVPWEVLAGLHFVETGGTNSSLKSLVSGRDIGANEPDVVRAGGCSSQNYGPGKPSPVSGGCGFANLTDSAIYAGDLIKKKISGRVPNTFQDASEALSLYNGGGNRNCAMPWETGKRTIYTGCPRLFVGEDDPYVMSYFDYKHRDMYLVYCADLQICTTPRIFGRGGAMAVIRGIVGSK